MIGEEEEDAGGETQGQFQNAGGGGGGRRTFWRSASWSSSRTAQQRPAHFDVNECADPHVNDNKNEGQFRRFPVPLTPRSQQNCKARACLPPLQPLSIARRSLDEWPKAGSDDVGEWPQSPNPNGRAQSLKPREGLKLDVSLFQKNPDPSGSLVNRDRIAFFDKECSKVAEHIYLGGDVVARNRDILRTNGITHVLNCVGFVCPEYFKADLVYKTLWLQDSPSEDITSILYDVFDYFEDVREQGGRVLVHCCQGVSRSTSLVIAYLMWREGQSFDDAFQYVKAARGIANPNMGFACQLLQCQKRVHAIPLSPSSVLRMYRMAPHSPYDPLHLVPKMLNDPSPSGLDSRGAFIIHVPSAIYVWIGKSCEPIMERDTKGAAFQVVRYERVQGPIISVMEGEEPSEFWDAFYNVPHSVDKSSNESQVKKHQRPSVVKIGPGERKVDLYDVDFELFQKAIAGGVVPPFSSSEAGQETHLPARENNWSLLRRKFTSGKMKECVSVPKISLSRVYSDSALIVDSDKCVNTICIPPFSSDLSTSSSPSYLSPNSCFSDSSTSSKFSSESPLLSPSTSSCSLTPSPASSTSSDSLFRQSNNSIHPVCNSPGAPGACHTSKPCSQTVLSPSKRFALCLAERRGSLSPSLKLPSLRDNTSLSSRRLKNSSISSLASQENGFESNCNPCSLDKPCNTEEVPQFRERIASDEGDATQENRSQNCPDKSITDGLFCKQVAETSEEPPSNSSLQEGLEFLDLNGSMDRSSKLYNGLQPLVCRWPNVEKVAAFTRDDLDSRSAFLFLAPSTGVNKDMDRIPYLWIGKSCKRDNCHIKLNNCRDLAGVEDADWNQVGCDLLSLMDLPKDITIKVVNEEEEPAEFLELLNSL